MRGMAREQRNQINFSKKKQSSKQRRLKIKSTKTKRRRQKEPCGALHYKPWHCLIAHLYPPRRMRSAKKKDFLSFRFASFGPATTAVRSKKKCIMGPFLQIFFTLCVHHIASSLIQNSGNVANFMHFNVQFFSCLADCLCL